MSSFEPKCLCKSCNNPFDHVTAGHMCSCCGKYGHGSVECENKELISAMTLLTSEHKISENKQCTVVNCETKWTHTNASHYYTYNEGENMDTSFTAENIEIIKNVSSYAIIKCPMCRTQNYVSSRQKKVRGLEDTCKICYDRTAEIYFPQYGHVNSCSVCFKFLNGI